MSVSSFTYSQLIQQWVSLYNGTGNSIDGARAICKNLSGPCYYVTGYSIGNGTSYDYATVKYCDDPSGIQQTGNEIPAEYKLYNNYPNPFNPSTKIKFDVPLNSPFQFIGEGLGVRLSVYDILGREITTLVNENLKPGTYETDWNSSNYPGGVYFYKLTANNFSETKKMLLIK